MRQFGGFGRVLVVTLLLLAGQAHALTAVQSARLWRAPDNTRLVFDLGGPVEHKLFVLSAPDRIVIDIDQADLRAVLNQLPLTNTPIRSIRAARRDNQNLRLVLELTTPVNPKSFTLTPNDQYGHRLVVDLFDVHPVPGVVTTQPPMPPRAVVSNGGERPVSAPTPQPVRTTPAPIPLPSGKRPIIIAIDAGHGGEDPGALGASGQQEKNITLAIARELQRQINQQQGYRAELVRTGDYFIPLRRRTEIARSKGADLFVSIHADAAPSRSASGASVYALSDRGATSETARWLADSENKSDRIGGVGGVSLDDKDPMVAGVLLDLSMTSTMTSSLKVGSQVLGHISRFTPLHKQRVEQAGFMVLKSPDIPSILVETGFISNTSEAQKLSNVSHQRALAQAVRNGIQQFFQQAPPHGTYIAWLRERAPAAQTVQRRP